MTPPILDHLHECLRGELTALISIYNLCLVMLRERLVQHRKGMTGLHRERDCRGNTLRLAQSTTAGRETNPLAIVLYVVSSAHTWLARLRFSPRNR